MKLIDRLKQYSAKVNYSADALKAQAAAVDMAALEKQVERLSARVIVLGHAFDVMHDGTHPHPFAAFLHAFECQMPDELNTDVEFCTLIDIWARMCKVGPTPIQMHGHPVDFDKKQE